MGANSKIGWTHHTFNPWWGCEKVSAACKNCYAEAFAKRTGNRVWGLTATRRFFGESHWSEPRKWDREAQRAGVRRRVFCASMADVFEGRDDLRPWRRALWRLIVETPNLDWLLLTKRPENVMREIPAEWRCRLPDNVWIGATMEDQEQLDLRWEAMREIPAKVLFASIEPILGPINLHGKLSCLDDPTAPRGLDWIIVGGESGPKRRECEIAWIEDVVDQTAGMVPVFVKQDSGPREGMQGRIPDWLWDLKMVPGQRIDENGVWINE